MCCHTLKYKFLTQLSLIKNNWIFQRITLTVIISKYRNHGSYHRVKKVQHSSIEMTPVLLDFTLLSSFSAEFDGVQDAVLELESSHWYVFCRRVKLVLLCVFVHLWGHGFVFLLRPEVSLNHVKRFLVDLAVLVALEEFYLV